MRVRIAALGLGLVFGIVLCWSGMSSPDVIRGALLLQQSYLFLFFGSAVGTAALSLALVRRRERRALLVDAPVAWAREQPERRHISGSVLFGIGWGVSNGCPGPIATQVGMGIGWSLFLMTGVVAGVWLFLRRGERETEPAVDRVARRPTGEVVSINT
jgi:uncharacterized membrane protein YedE/YeeE